MFAKELMFVLVRKKSLPTTSVLDNLCTRAEMVEVQTPQASRELTLQPQETPYLKNVVDLAFKGYTLL